LPVRGAPNFSGVLAAGAARELAAVAARNVARMIFFMVKM
jgi:hypothetical protein